MNPLVQALMSQLKVKNPQGYQLANNLMQNNGNPQAMLHQLMSNASPEQKENLMKQAKQYGVPDNILSQIQNMK